MATTLPPVLRTPRPGRFVGSLAAALGALAVTIPARADTDCALFKNSVVVAGSTAIKPLLAEIAKIMAASTASEPEPVTVLYIGGGSCVGVDAALNGTIQNPATVSYWDLAGTEQTCSPASTGGLVANIGVSDVFASTCAPLPNGLPSNVVDFLGPVQAMTFVVPKASSQDTISAEAAYYVFGFGNESGAAPWTDENVIFQRNDQSGTQRMIAAAIGVDANLWRGTKTTSSSDLRQQVIAAGSTNAEGAIGILSADDADTNRATLSVLAYQHFGQACGTYPDRDASSNEKENVRNGNYLIWGPMHLLTTVDNAQRASNPIAADIIGYIVGTKAPPAGLDLVALEAEHHVVPQCAMHVSRAQELGPLSAYEPTEPCGCYYEKLANGASSCRSCTSDNDCDAGTVCSFHYCERL
jgi:ABC-type phosphate transport system substrate-binding protein